MSVLHPPVTFHSMSLTLPVAAQGNPSAKAVAAKPNNLPQINPVFPIPTFSVLLPGLHFLPQPSLVRELTEQRGKPSPSRLCPTWTPHESSLPVKMRISFKTARGSQVSAKSSVLYQFLDMDYQQCFVCHSILPVQSSIKIANVNTQA